MRLIIKGKNTDITPALKIYIEEKLVKSAKKLLGKQEDLPLLEIEFSRTTRHHHKGMVWRAEANLAFGKRLLRAEQTGEDPHEVIDLVREELLREIKSVKEKTKVKEIRGARKIKRMLRKGA